MSSNQLRWLRCFLLILTVPVAGLGSSACMAPTPPPAPETTDTLPEPIPLPQATPTPPAERLLQSNAVLLTILSFTADPLSIDPGQTVTLSWTSEGADKAFIVPLLPSGQFSAERWKVAPSGTRVVQTSPADRNWRGFVLRVEAGAGHTAESQLTITFRCPDIYFFSPDVERWGCPGGPPAFTPAAEQIFQGGRMIWLQDKASIYVFYNDGPAPHWDLFEDTWTEGEPESDPGYKPPDGRLQPIRGFGKLWRTDATVRERLGWALVPEQGFPGAYQFDSCAGGTVSSCASLYLKTNDEQIIRRPAERADQWEILTP